jgi:mevalonate kinase
LTAVRASAPGKLMLFGEYAVLHGYPAVALCLDRRISCTATPGKRLVLYSPGVFEPAIDLPVSALESETPPDSRLGLLWPLLRRYAFEGVTLSFEAGFPPTWGLGSSSASTLAAAAALVRHFGHEVSDEQLFSAVHEAQRSLQGRASGYDAATQLLGGYVSYRMGDPPTMLHVDPPLGRLRWVVGYTGRKARTGSMIRDVEGRHPAGSDIYEEIGALAEQAVPRLQAGDATALGVLLNAGHARLEKLGAVPDDLAAVVRALQGDPDVLGARMSGAGGGDCILILADDPAYAARAAEQHGLQILDLQPESQGLLYESA